ncbi:MAG: hypothetical protein AAF799_06925 [Myxococcota bacterium]
MAFVRPLPSLLLAAGMLAPVTALAAPAPGSDGVAPAPAPAPAPAATAAPASTPAPAAAPVPAAATAPAPGSDATTAASAESAATPAPTPTETSTPPRTAIIPTPTPSATAAPPATPEYVNVPINIGVTPSLSVNGANRRGGKIRNTLSASLLWSRVDRLEGAAVAMGATIVDEDAQGITWALGANLTHGEHRGIQAAQFYNHAHDLRGIQTGTINHVHQARGAQFGLLNLSRGQIRGVQFGLINYAGEADASFALLPVTKKGGVHPEVWTSDTAAINVGIRLPANYTYAFFAGGLHPWGRGQTPSTNVEAGTRRPGTALMAGMGYGGHIPVSKQFSIDGDLSAWVVTSGLRAAPPVGSLAKARAMVSWQPRPRFAIWGGPTFNVLVDSTSSAVARPGYGWGSQAYVDSGVRVRWWPGFAAGLRF